MNRGVLLIVAVGWLAWMVPFFRVTWGPAAQTIDRRARWGMVLEAVGFAVVWAKPWWIRDPAPWRFVPGLLFLAAAPLLTWTSAVALGRHWRVDAGLNADHRLVQSGAYRVVRHPVYTSMICLLLGTGFLITRLDALAVATMLIVAGTEIRVRVEDRLLESRFGEQFRAYRRRTHAYLPLTWR